MANYLHGAYGSINIAASKVASKSDAAFVYIGTAPVHLCEDAYGQYHVNEPVVVNSIDEAREKFGYSDNFEDYTLCEAMKVHFIDNSVGPIVLINVLDPDVHTESGQKTATVTPVNGRAMIVNAEKVCINTITVKSGSATKTKGTDYEVSYDENRKAMIISELTVGALGKTELTVTYTEIKPAAVKAADIIGSDNGAGMHTGIYAVKNVYQATGYIPSFLLAPGFASVKEVHDALIENSRKINGHWDAYLFVDLPLYSDALSSTALSIKTAAAWKNENGYNNVNESVYFPMVRGTDGKRYHISVLAAANLQKLLVKQEGVPYKTASNTEIAIAQGLSFAPDGLTGTRFYDDEMINNYLCKNGISSACYIGGRWAIWGAHSASYDASNPDSVSVAETSRMMLYYISNNFQARRSLDVDKPMTVNDLKSIVSEEQARLDALVKIGALTYAEVMMNASMHTMSDIVNGDFKFAFSITTTPLAKSLTAMVSWTDAGFVTYYESMNT